jgi:hypothetical protein
MKRCVISLSLLALLVGAAWAPPAEARTPRTVQVAPGKQPRQRFWKRWSHNVGRILSATRVRFRKWTAPRPRPADWHLQPMKRMVRSGRMSTAEYNRALKALGYPVPAQVDKGALARQRLKEASRTRKELRPLVRMIEAGRLSEVDTIRAEQALLR